MPGKVVMLIDVLSCVLNRDDSRRKWVLVVSLDNFDSRGCGTVRCGHRPVRCDGGSSN